MTTHERSYMYFYHMTIAFTTIKPLWSFLYYTNLAVGIQIRMCWL